MKQPPCTTLDTSDRTESIARTDWWTPLLSRAGGVALLVVAQAVILALILFA